MGGIQYFQSQRTVSSDMIENRIPFSEPRKQRYTDEWHHCPVHVFCDDLDTWASGVELEPVLPLLTAFLDDREVLIPILNNY